MKTRKILSMILAFLLCLSSFTVLANEESAEEFFITASNTGSGILGYTLAEHWAYWGNENDKEADIFVVYPTVDKGEHGYYFGDVTDENYRNEVKNVLKPYVDEYKDELNCYAPIYREVNDLIYEIPEKEEREVCYAFAYRDIKEAFLYYAKQADPAKPLILAGYKEGADMIIRLMKDLFDEDKYQRRLVAAYCEDYNLTDEELEKYPHLVLSESDTDTGVIVTSALSVDDKDARLSAYKEKNKGNISVIYDNEVLDFDVNPVIENGRTLVPFRKIFEAMGCSVGYAVDEEGKQIVSARRGNNNLLLTIGENVMTFNGESKELDVPAIIKDSRTLVPIRAITEAFDCEVFWDGERQIVTICPPYTSFEVTPNKLSETIKDDEGNVLIEAVAYYPYITNDRHDYTIDDINDTFEFTAENFINEAKQRKDEAINLRNEMGAENFTPFVFEMTYEETYNIYGILSVTYYKYVNVGGMHPSIEMESMSFIPGMEEELSVSTTIDENALDDDLIDFVVKLFVEELKTILPDTDTGEIYNTVHENLAYIQFYLAEKSIVFYMNQGEVFPYALGVISVSLPYEPQLFLVDMDTNCVDEYTHELEFYEDHEWVVVNYSEDKVKVTVENEVYDPETLLSEYYPLGMTRVKFEGISQGNAKVSMAHINKEEGLNDSTRVITTYIYVDENNKITIVTESEDVLLLKQSDFLSENK